MTFTKRLAALALAAALLICALPFSVGAEEEHKTDMVEFTLDINGWEKVPTSRQITVFENDSDETRTVRTDKYNFMSSRVMVFNADGLMTEAGENLYGNKDGTTVVLRPEAATLGDTGGMPCRVVLSCFMGSYQNYHVMLGDTLVKLEEHNPKNKRIYQVDETCHLLFDPASVHVL